MPPRHKQTKSRQALPWWRKHIVLSVIGSIIFLAAVGIFIYSSYSLKQEEKKRQPPPPTKLGKIKLTKDNGVSKDILVVGTGEQAAYGKKVRINYNYSLADGKILDSTVGKEPFTFEVGGQVIEGLSIAVASMKVGEKARIVLSPKYGHHQSNDPIVSQAQLIFVVELVEILP
jgi:FKBP-type peptidyl-prolyl cis-trans isomerase